MNVANRILSRYLDTNGDGSGTKQATGNYSGAEEIFYIQPPVGVTFTINRLLVKVQDTGLIDAAGYGAGAALANGIVVREKGAAGVATDLTDGLPIKDNATWGALCYDAQRITWGTGDEMMLVRWTFEKAAPLLLEGDGQDRLEVVVNDNLTVLVAHTFLAQGFRNDLKA